MWGLGYISSDWECEEENDPDYDPDEQEQTIMHGLIEKMLAKQQLTEEEMEQVGDSYRMRDVYNTRWYMASGDQLTETYFAMHNKLKYKAIKAGE